MDPVVGSGEQVFRISGVTVERTYNSMAQPGGGLEKLLGDLEREIMEVMWSRSDRSVRDVMVELNERREADRRLAYTTVMTVMARLAEKGLLSRRRVGKAHEYEAADTREGYLARASQELARRMVEDFGEAAVSGFLNVLEDVAPERLTRLRRRLQRRDRA
jgi:predicted transcriptional regulator